MDYPAELSVKYSYDTGLFTCKWQVQDGQGRKAAFAFTTGMDFDTETFEAKWQRPDGTEGSITGKK